MSDTSRTCVRFRLGREGFGLPLDEVREIAAVPAITLVPMAPPMVRGLVSLRGQVVTLIDAATLFSRTLPAARTREDRLALVFSPPWDHLALYVHAPVEVGEATLALSMTMSAGEEAAAASGPSGALASASGEILHLLSARDLVSWCEARVIEGFRRRN